MIILVAALILASGFFSLFEQALKAAGKPHLYQETDSAEKKGSRCRRRLLKAAENSERYLMAARFWRITLRTLAAVIAGINLNHWMIMRSAALPVFLPAAVCTAAVILAILLPDSLIPWIVRRAAEGITAAALPFLEICALPLLPFYLLTHNACRQLRKIFPAGAEPPAMTEDDLRLALMEGEKSGIVESKERTMVEGVFYLGDRPLGTFMTHRSEIQWLDVNAPLADISAKVLEYRHQRCFPVTDGTLDAIIGAAYSEDIIIDAASAPSAGLRAIMKTALFAPETMPALKAFESFRRGKADFLFVMDEYGGFAGIVSVHDLMEAIVGELTAPVSAEEQAVEQEDGSWLADGGLNIDEAADLFSLPGLSAAMETSGGGAHSGYHTLAGFVLSLAGELPRSGDSFVYQGFRFTVLEMDGNRIEKIAVRKEEKQTTDKIKE
ncbi:MAG: hemolysin family protein [Treponema sp.]|jgi:putative hemolysin|nr:hemolysin family protein [Treponema sp.]